MHFKWERNLRDMTVVSVQRLRLLANSVTFDTTRLSQFHNSFMTNVAFIYRIWSPVPDPSWFSIPQNALRPVFLGRHQKRGWGQWMRQVDILNETAWPSYFIALNYVFPSPQRTQPLQSAWTIWRRLRHTSIETQQQSKTLTLSYLKVPSPGKNPFSLFIYVYCS